MVTGRGQDGPSLAFRLVPKGEEGGENGEKQAGFMALINPGKTCTPYVHFLQALESHLRTRTRTRNNTGGMDAQTRS